MFGNEEQKLKRRLRELPPLPIPDGLEARLLDAIRVAPVALNRKRRTAPIALITFGAIAASFFIAFARLRTAEHPAKPKFIRRITDRDVQPRFILPSAKKEETRPCDILPPFEYRDVYASAQRSW
jgi:hypothetical protein